MKLVSRGEEILVVRPGLARKGNQEVVPTLFAESLGKTTTKNSTYQAAQSAIGIGRRPVSRSIDGQATLVKQDSRIACDGSEWQALQ